MKQAASMFVFALGLCACSDVAAPSSPQTAPAHTPGSPSNNLAENALPTASTVTSPASSPVSAPAAAPTTTAPVSTGIAGAPATEPASDSAAAAAELAPSEAAPALGEPEDNCEDRRVSYARPCHNDPNPCGIDSGYPGDEYCLLPPKPEEGFQIHIGPKDYSDADEVAKYTIAPGDEFNNSVLGHIPSEEDVWFDRITVQMRPGSHHWISSVVAGKPEERFYTGTSCDGAEQIGSIGGGQNLIYDNPPGGIPAPENAGLGRPLPGKSSLCMNLHAYNFSEETQLREIWINIYTVPEDEVSQRAAGIGVVGGLGMAVPPGAKETITYTETFSGDGRIIQLFGHRHAWTPRFAVWLNDDLIYDSWNWEESITFNYDSLTTNPEINTEAQVDGAVSGSLEYKSGDTLKFSCFVENDSNQTIRWANELYGGEMCNLWGSVVGQGIRATHL